jgi:hypothetical protein
MPIIVEVCIGHALNWYLFASCCAKSTTFHLKKAGKRVQ